MDSTLFLMTTPIEIVKMITDYVLWHITDISRINTP